MNSVFFPVPAIGLSKWKLLKSNQWLWHHILSVAWFYLAVVEHFRDLMGSQSYHLANRICESIRNPAQIWSNGPSNPPDILRVQVLILSRWIFGMISATLEITSLSLSPLNSFQLIFWYRASGRTLQDHKKPQPFEWTWFIGKFLTSHEVAVTKHII